MRWLLVLLTILLLVSIAFAILVAVRAQQLRNDEGSVPPAEIASAPGEPAQPEQRVLAATGTDNNDPLGIPVARNGDVQILKKTHFTIGYDNAALEPAWVSYALAGPVRFHGKEQRPQHFATDLDVKNPAKDSDYVRSGYDRGHMCPAYAMFSRFGQSGLEETFITSNIIPQVHPLNAGLWEALEAEVAGRDGTDDGWAGAFGEVWVTDGPVFTTPLQRLKAGEAIPRACFMIITKKGRNDRYDTLAFELPNEQATERPESYLVSIRRIESDTGLDFDAALSLEDQEALEVESAKDLWAMPSASSRSAPEISSKPHHHRR